MQTGAYSRQMLSLPEEDVQLLKVHEPQIFKKIRDHISMTIEDIISLQKLGFTYEGCLKSYLYFAGRAHDIEMFAVTPAVAKQKSENFAIPIAHVA